ncbi:MAG: hypothetical protein Q8N26_34855 [Myxococcales bacterium]|nr:hypothetical protein [Myxococcales bacterium]
MRRADLLVVLISVAVPGVALANADARAARLLVETPTSVEAPSTLTPSRTTRLLAEGGVSAGLGVVLPFAAYGGLTALQSFVGFFAGFLSATVLGVVLAPIGVILTGRLLGAEGGVGRGVVGALLGLLAGLLIGLPLATLPGAGYLLGLGLLWTLPSVGALVAFEWGRAEQAPTTGAVVFRF